MSSGANPTTDSDDWYISCSDDEKYKATGCKRGHLKWTPAPQDMVRLFQTLDKDGVGGLQLDWKCQYGRRPRTPNYNSEEEDSEDDSDELSDEHNAGRSADTSNFDFDGDDDSLTPSVTPRRPPGASRLTGAMSRELKGSARKKTTDLKNILSKMERNRMIDAREKAAAAGKGRPK